MTSTVNQPGKRGAQSGRRPFKVAYMMSRFPKLTETFILLEMVAVEKQGGHIELYPLLREKTAVMHPEAWDYVARAHYAPFVSGKIVLANLVFLVRRPAAYLKMLGAVLTGTWSSRRFLTGALGILPKSVYFAQQMVRDGVTHVHAHFASHPALAAFIIRRLTGISFSFTAHGSDIYRDQTMLAQKVAEAAFVVPISETNRDFILQQCQGRYAEKFRVIHCGVDTTFFRPVEADDRLPVGPEAAVLCVGTLHEVQGQRYLIEACRLLKERGLIVACHFIGDGPDREMLAGLATQAGLADQIHFHGLQPRAEVARWLRAVSIVAAPSVPSRDGRREGIPVALMEAMASGTAVVASRLSGIPELIEDQVNGLLTPPGEASALADALMQLLADDSLRQRLAQAARARVMAAFDLEQNARALLQAFQREVEQV